MAVASGSYKKVISYVILIISCIFVWFFVQREQFDFGSILNIGWFDAAAMSAISIAVFFANGIQNTVLLRPFNIRLKTSEWFGVSVVNSFWNYLPFQGGLVAKGLYLKRRYQFSYTEYLSMLTASYLITFFVVGIVGLAGLVAALWNGFTISWLPVAIYGGVVVLSFLVFAALVAARRLGIRWSFAERFFQGVRILMQHRSVIWQSAFLNVVIIFLAALRLSIASNALGYDISIFFYILVGPITLLATFTSITPGGLVIREALVGAFAAWFAVNVSDSVTAAVLDRGISMIWIFALGIVFNYYLSRQAISREPDSDSGEVHEKTVNMP
ncbi:MAG: lysylphosphatidylglycerol synthase transmembrane domain-containing protein [Patescibacteria group bacterium]|nr:lysylphosphatidylglycerol synthase transmembrane domain-containing protein [Patescibacteria group bacterium]MDD5715954.1 lysylphosphatidylglycerol synthase transmembrane domain-containing protein [Patescibacteria group bacterium]